MRQLKVKADPALFARWRHLEMKIGTLKSAVQNDMEITDQEQRKWKVMAEDLRKEMGVLISDTAYHMLFGPRLKKEETL